MINLCNKYAWIYVTLVVFSIGCKPIMPTAYFNDLAPKDKIELPPAQLAPTVIQVNDLIDIKISGKNEESAKLFNNATVVSGSLVSQPYLVDSRGEVEIYKLGKIRVAGLTTEQLKERLTNELERNKFLLEPMVSVQFVNFKFSVLGDVKLPGTFSVQSDRISILEALGHAGDMLPTAQKNVVRVIRDSSGKREIGTVNFTQQTIFTSPYYYLRRGDVVYVEPGIVELKPNEKISIFTSAVAAVASLVAIGIAVFRN